MRPHILLYWYLLEMNRITRPALEVVGRRGAKAVKYRFCENSSVFCLVMKTLVD